MVLGGDALLTPGLFRELDDACRLIAGKPLSMFRRAEQTRWGACEYMASSVYRDLRLLKHGNGDEQLFTEISLLLLANEIDIASFHGAQRPSDLGQPTPANGTADMPASSGSGGP